MIPYNLQEYSTETLFAMRIEIERANDETETRLREIYAAKKEHENTIRHLLSQINKLTNQQHERQDAYYRVGKELRNRGAINYRKFRLQSKAQ